MGFYEPSGLPNRHRRGRSRLATSLPARLTTLRHCRQVILLDLSLGGARICLPYDYSLASGNEARGDALLAWDDFEAFGSFAWVRLTRHGAEAGLRFDPPIDDATLVATRHLHDAFCRRGGLRTLLRDYARDWVQGGSDAAG